MRERTRISIVALSLALGACRDARSGGSSTVTLTPSTAGANGCAGPNQVFTAPQTPSTVAFSTWNVGASSQITAAAGSELLYATGASGQVVALDFDSGSLVETELVGGTTIQTLTGSAPDLSGIAVLDAQTLLVIDRGSHTIVAVDRITADTVAAFAGLTGAGPGFADGLASGARFNFSAPTQLCPTGSVPGRVLVADAGNHAIRVLDEVDPTQDIWVVDTLTGLGTPGFEDGDLADASFDTPNGLSVACNGTLIVSEHGDFGAGQRLRQLEVGSPSPFSGFLGTSTTLVGTGVDDTLDDLSGAPQVSQPAAPLVTSEGDVYWIDSGSGVLRRRVAAGTVDCPLAIDCATAVGAPTFPAGHAFSLTMTGGGVLYVLDATDGVLYRVTP